jgi:outer membrane protein TolC
MNNAPLRWAALAFAGLASLPSSADAQVAVEADTLRLATAVQAALGSDPRVSAAAARLGQAGAARGVAAAARLPTLSTSALVNRFGEPMVVAPLHGFDSRRARW